jgi:hypothetical protein
VGPRVRQPFVNGYLRCSAASAAFSCGELLARTFAQAFGGGLDAKAPREFTSFSRRQHRVRDAFSIRHAPRLAPALGLSLHHSPPSGNEICLLKAMPISQVVRERGVGVFVLSLTMRLPWVQEVAGSNPVAPTDNLRAFQISSQT